MGRGRSAPLVPTYPGGARASRGWAYPLLPKDWQPQQGSGPNLAGPWAFPGGLCPSSSTETLCKSLQGYRGPQWGQSRRGKCLASSIPVLPPICSISSSGGQHPPPPQPAQGHNSKSYPVHLQKGSRLPTFLQGHVRLTSLPQPLQWPPTLSTSPLPCLALSKPFCPKQPDDW